ncbi:hypothetical protein CEXT_88531 [Caerostris extrusa]|uniref:Uncharacterized protein n=1 Tax=Caerostris extrusa TaxID=172846 RepID=A0AAV4WSA4_CAEEX|nr:hypothetical protein CEXT_88531 [Caerostris extrusa]
MAGEHTRKTSAKGQELAYKRPKKNTLGLPRRDFWLPSETWSHFLNGQLLLFLLIISRAISTCPLSGRVARDETDLEERR